MTSEAWPGLTADKVDTLAAEYEIATQQCALAAYQEHPDNEAAAGRRMVELKVGLARAMVDAVKRFGCPDDQATETAAGVIERVVESRRACEPVDVAAFPGHVRSTSPGGP